jgi:hypothetical protein
MAFLGAKLVIDELPSITLLIPDGFVVSLQHVRVEATYQIN